MIITTTKELIDTCAHFSGAPFVTMDTEFIREKTYYPDLCLIQIASDDLAVCIDPLSPDLDMTPLFELLQNPNVVKVFHAARQDIEIFYHLTGKIPTPIFDTQIAAMVCGYNDAVGYQQLVKDLSGVDLDKSMRFTDWSRRPLNNEQIAYALHDVTYLRDVYKSLRQSLEETKRTEWLSEEIAVQNDPTTYETDNDSVWKRFKIPFKKAKQLHLFARLCAWREETAKRLNRPRRFILKDDALTELAIMPPADIREMALLRNIPSGFAAGKLGGEVLSVIQKALQDAPESWKENWTPQKPLPQKQRALVELLHLLLSVVANDLHVAPRILATNEDLTAFARGETDIPCLSGWRKEVFGDKILKFKQGDLAFRYNPQTHGIELID